MNALSPEHSVSDTPHWRRGNLHTHTFWSDGDDFPECAAKWYKEHGYDFLLFTDHNVLLKGERWRSFPKDNQALARYRELFGNDWVQTRPDNEKDNISVRVRPLDDFRDKVEEPQKFLLLQGMELHFDIGQHLVSLRPDKSLEKITCSEEDYRLALKKIAGQTVLAHPTLGWDVSAEKMAKIENLRFFEVYNGYGDSFNYGDALHAGTDRLWDIVLAFRLSKNDASPLYGVATDDVHTYFAGGFGPGRGWVMVNSHQLTQGGLLDALDRGDFYASTGVALRKIALAENTISVEIEPHEGVEYVTEYIGTRRGFDPTSSPAVDDSGKEMPNATRKYSQQIGEVLFRTTDCSSSYTFSGDELYVRARITSTAHQMDPVTGKPLTDKQRAWGQPMVPPQGLR